MPDDLLSKWPDLLINILGVLIGGLLAYGIAKWQISRQAEDKKKEDLKLLSNKFEKACVEIRDNRNKAEHLYKAMRESSKEATVQEWNYFISIGNSLSFVYYHDIIRSGLNNLLPDSVNNELYSAYDMTQDLFNFIQQCYNQSLALRSIPNPKVALTMPQDNLKTYSKTVWDHLNRSVDILYKHKNDIAA
jgi:hypothetical protein